MLDEAQYIQQAHYIFSLEFNFINSDPPTPTGHYPLKLLNKMASDLTGRFYVSRRSLPPNPQCLCMFNAAKTTRFV